MGYYMYTMGSTGSEKSSATRIALTVKTGPKQRVSATRHEDKHPLSTRVRIQCQNKMFSFVQCSHFSCQIDRTRFSLVTILYEGEILCPVLVCAVYTFMYCTYQRLALEARALVFGVRKFLHSPFEYALQLSCDVPLGPIFRCTVLCA